MKRFLSAALAALTCLSLTACGQAAPPAASSGGESAGSSAAVSAPAEPAAPPTGPERAAAVLAELTTAEKVGQLFFARCPESGGVTDVGAYHLGGYVLFGRDFKDRTANEIVQTLRAYQEAAGADTGIPLLLGADEEGGTVVRVSSNPKLCSEKFASPQQLLAANGLEGLTRDAHEKDALLRALGINVNLAPVCDVSTDPADFIYARSMGMDAEGTAGCVSAVVGQMADDGMGSVLKHFPGYGSNVDTHTGIAVDERPLESFEASDFQPFSAGITAGVRDGGQTAAVLVSHNIMTAVDDALPASLSPAVHALLRDKLGFTGVAMTDDLAMDAVKAYAEDGDVAVLALLAGNDLIVTTDYKTQIPQVLEALQDGRLDESVVDAACLRVLTWKAALGLI